MHWGVFRGKDADKHPEKILILAESHHISKKDCNNRVAGKEATYSTESVIRNDYFQNPTYANYRIFDKIALSFGVEPEQPGMREAFWEKVYFGNYIDVLCGVGDTTAKNIIQKGDNRKTYNDELFRFINEHQINIVFCFSRLVYNNLPDFSDREHEALEDIPCGKIGKRNDFIKRRRYLANTKHDKTNELLRKDLLVFDMRHPSARCGYDPAHYAERLKHRIP